MIIPADLLRPSDTGTSRSPETSEHIVTRHLRATALTATTSIQNSNKFADPAIEPSSLTSRALLLSWVIGAYSSDRDHGCGITA
jgi:hypothetical protein